MEAIMAVLFFGVFSAFLVGNEPVEGRVMRPDFWDQFPDMWRGVAPLSGAQQLDVSRRNRFEDWRNAQQSVELTTPNGARNVHDSIRDLFPELPSGGNGDGIRTAMMSLGAPGNVQPGLGRGEFSLSSLFPEFQMPLAPRDWWNGPNVCVERREEDLLANSSPNPVNSSNGDSNGNNGGSIHINSCTRSPDNEMYSCVTEIRKANFHRKYSVKYQCCYGFSRENDASLGCSKAIPMTNLPDTLTNLKLTALVQALSSDSRLRGLLESAGNFTIFAPSNEAFEEFQRPINEVGSNGPSQDLFTTLKSSIVSGLVRSSDLTDEQVLTSIVNSSIRINLFATPSQVITADCARIVSLNNLARNGVVHIVDRVIRPVTKTLDKILRDDGRFSTLLQLLEDAGLTGQLRDLTNHITILAPTDAAFRSMERGVRNRLGGDGNCLKRVLQTHILPNVICSAVVERNAITANILNKVMRFDRDVDRLTVQNVSIASADHMAVNGMFYVLDGVIIPEEAKSLLQIAKDAGLTSYISIVEKANYGHAIDSLHNVTIFAPSNRALDRLSDRRRSALGRSAKDLTDILQFHTVRPSVLMSDFKDNLVMNTALEGKSLRMNIYEAFPFGKNIITVNCVKITVANLRGCDGTVHVLSNVLIPPTGSILQTLESSGNFTKFLDGIRKTGLDRTLQGKGPFTVFAPTDQAFALLSPDEAQAMTSNATLLLDVMQLHIFPRQICCAGIMEDSLFFGQYSRSLNPTYSLPLHRNRYGEIRIASALVEKCDVIAENGIIHFVDKVVYPKNAL
ncbi:Transforming growth factor-beta-induced protein ig-h3 [Hypsibius exemplaris]|uniref:Transforming growth factor-beta-induced protein ig-h3 n=1 Tax=Hypsibius exemplaris TaxID=2072580 RepID=A0A1W0X9V9_HYPEX|nr:Transforming growth factor-beta-induced protein ig-h3 [Hypsibius exemplaris]